MAIVKHVADLALKHHNGRHKGDGIGNHHGTILDDEAIKAPTGNSDTQ